LTSTVAFGDVKMPWRDAYGAGVFMIDHLLGNIDLAFTAQVFGEAGGAERVLLDTGLHIGIQADQSAGKHQLGFGAW
jgi:hypothetical protein